MNEAVLLTLTARWMAGWYLAGRLPTLETLVRDAAPAPQQGSVSVVIPARNEASSLPALLSSLSHQVLQPVEVIVVDDHSTDGTAAIANDAGVTVVTAGELPARWMGKPWACAQGAAAATGSTLVFLDADTVAGPQLLARLVAAVRHTGGLVSVGPYHRTERAYESASALFNLVAFMGTGASSVNRRAHAMGAFGPCIAITRKDYVRVGGHGAVRDEVLDDVALAHVCHAHGISVTNVAGARDLRYRMYPDGVAQLIEGWSKNFASGAARTPVWRVLAIGAWLSGLIEAGVMGIAAAALIPIDGAEAPWVHALFYVLFALQLNFLLRRIGNFSAIAWLHPIASLTFLAIFARSVILRARGEATWKGRTIVLDSRRDGHG